MRWLVGLLALGLLTLGLYTWTTLNWAYATGERAGYVQKLSKKGWVCKTWEGELAMTTVPGVAPVLWQFTVRDDAVADRVHGALGQRVVVHYAEHRGLPTTCFGDTPYFVDAVEVAKEPGS